MRFSRLAVFPLLAVIASGCFSSPRTVRSWTVDPAAESTVAVRGESLYGTTRLASVSALPPYDGDAIRVRRKDGTLPADALNRFASPTDRIFRRAALAALARDGRFGRVVAPNSTASADACVEIRIEEAVLDVKGSKARTASVVLAVDVLDGRTRALKLSGRGAGSASALSGDYTAAFTAAADAAFAAAFGDLK